MNTILNPKVIILFALPFFFIIYLFAHKPSSDSADQMANTNLNRETWQSMDLLSKQLPANIDELINKVNIEQSEIDICGATTFTQKADPPENVSPTGKVVLLLHGAAFTSQTWVDKVPTIATLAVLGHKVIAIDLPGFGKTKVYDKDATEDKGSYLAAAIDTLTPDVKPVIITPSMSGGFIIPLLSRSPEKISAWVPVAPVSTDKGRGFFPKLEVPTMIVYGELDTKLGVRSRDDLVLISTSTKPQILPGAKHPAYLDQPDLWHQLLFNFILAL